MNEDEFVKAATTDEATRDLLAEVADEVRGGPPERSFGSFTDPLTYIAGIAALSLLQVGISTLRGLSALKLAEWTAATGKRIEAMGYPQELAEKTVKATLDRFLPLSDNSPILQAFLKMLPSGPTPALPDTKDTTTDKTDTTEH